MAKTAPRKAAKQTGRAPSARLTAAPLKAESKPLSRGPSAGQPSRPSSLLDTRVIYCGDNLDQLKKLPPACIDLIYIDPLFNSNRNPLYRREVFWGETREKRAFEDRHASTQAYIDYMRPRCVELLGHSSKDGYS